MALERTIYQAWLVRGRQLGRTGHGRSTVAGARLSGRHVADVGGGNHSSSVALETGPRFAGVGIPDIEPEKEDRVLLQDDQYHSPTRTRVVGGSMLPRGQSRAKGLHSAG